MWAEVIEETNWLHHLISVFQSSKASSDSIPRLLQQAFYLRGNLAISYAFGSTLELWSLGNLVCLGLDTYRTAENLQSSLYWSCLDPVPASTRWWCRFGEEKGRCQANRRMYWVGTRVIVCYLDMQFHLDYHMVLDLTLISVTLLCVVLVWTGFSACYAELTSFHVLTPEADVWFQYHPPRSGLRKYAALFCCLPNQVLVCTRHGNADRIGWRLLRILHVFVQVPRCHWHM